MIFNNNNLRAICAVIFPIFFKSKIQLPRFQIHIVPDKSAVIVETSNPFSSANANRSRSSPPSLVFGGATAEQAARIIEMNVTKRPKSSTPQRVARGTPLTKHAPFELLNATLADSGVEPTAASEDGTVLLKDAVQDECTKLGIVCADGTTCLEARCLEICPPGTVRSTLDDRDCVPAATAVELGGDNTNAIETGATQQKNANNSSTTKTIVLPSNKNINSPPKTMATNTENTAVNQNVVQNDRFNSKMNKKSVRRLIFKRGSPLIGNNTYVRRCCCCCT